MNRKFLFCIAVVVIAASAVVAWLLLPQQKESLIYLGTVSSMLYGDKTEAQKVCFHLKNVGGATAEIYTLGIVNMWGETAEVGEGNYTFLTDIVIPPGVECLIEFSMWGGPVSVTTISGSPPAEGGDIASPNWSGLLPSGVYCGVSVYTRAGNQYKRDHVYIN